MLIGATPAAAQLRATKALTLDGAKNIVAAAEAEARKNNWSMSIAIVDAAGELVLFHKGDGTRPSNAEFAQRKARTAARFHPPTQSLDSSPTPGPIHLLPPHPLPIQGP